VTNRLSDSYRCKGCSSRELETGIEGADAPHMTAGPRLRIVVVGGINSDYLTRGPRLPGPGETLEGESFHEGPGGKGANQAVAAARLDVESVFVGRVGSDARGKALIEALRRERVDTTHVRIDAGAASGAAVIHVDERGEKQIFVAPGANARVGVDDVAAAADAFRGASVVLAQLEIPLDSVIAAARAARDAGARFVLDPAPARPLPDELLAMTEVIRPNAGEARTLTGIEVKDRASARAAADTLIRRGARVACVQAGAEGDLLVAGSEEFFLARLPVRSVDATGAGDAFAAALSVAIAEDWDWGRAGAFANAASALATTRLGAQDGLPSRGEVERLLAERVTAREAAG
jgi:ribokinase